MTFVKNYESVFVETTLLIYREEYLSEFKWNCYLTSKKLALKEMAVEPFWHYGPKQSGHLRTDCQRRACLLAWLFMSTKSQGRERSDVAMKIAAELSRT